MLLLFLWGAGVFTVYNRLDFCFTSLLGPKWLQGNLSYALQYRFIEPYVVKIYDIIIKAFRLEKKMTAYDALSSAFAQYATRYWESENAPKAVREATANGERSPYVI